MSAPQLPEAKDRRDAHAVEKAVAMAVAAFGRLDIVFANAGIAATTPIRGGSVATFDEVLRTNLTGVFLMVQAAAPHLNDGA